MALKPCFCCFKPWYTFLGRKAAVTLNENADETRPRGLFARHRRPIIIGGVLFLLIVGSFVYWLLSRGKQSTDDAQINGHMVMVTARVASHVRFVTVDDTDHVKQGQLLVQLDRRDLFEALRRAQADLASQIAQTTAAINQVAITQRTAPSTNLQAVATTAIAGQAIVTSQTQLTSAEAEVVSANAAVGAAQEQVHAAKTDYDAAIEQVSAAQQSVTIAQADVTAARSNAQTQAREAQRYTSMYKQGAVSREQAENYANISTNAQSAYRSAMSRLQTAQVGVTQAIARREGARALLARANRLVASSQASLVQAKANVRAAQSGLRQAESRLNQAQAAQMGTQTVPQQIGASIAQSRAAAAKIAQSRAAVRSARLNLSYTEIRASKTGEIVSRAVNAGQYVQPGQAMMAIVPENDVWVTANFKETQIEHMKPGQRAEITVDTYGGRRFYGRVQGIGAASGEKLSLLPPENATGNFVKVVQRIPVRINIDRPFPKGIVFRPGQNVIVTVYTR